MTEDVIKVGEYIVIKKKDYMKLQKFSKPDTSVTLGRDTVSLSGIEGCSYLSMFRMIPKSKKGREYRLELADEIQELKNEIDIKESGTDNRNIIDDGRSQKLTAAEIADLANDATKASDIVETLISNSNTFHNKTEYSQEKYLKKKERKYFEYIQILKPNLRLISEIMYNFEPGKIQNIRIDTLSQIITMSNVHSEGVHLLYDSGSNGLVVAALLSAIGEKTNGKLIHMHPGNMSQKQALLGMNFSEEQYNRCISVNLYSALRQYYQGCDTHSKTVKEMEDSESNLLKRKAEENDNRESKIPKLESQETSGDLLDKNEISETELLKTSEKQQLQLFKENDDTESKTPKLESQETNGNPSDKNETSETEPPKTSDDSSYPEPKKPKWHFDNIAAAELLSQKVDSLVIACKEDPLNLFMELYKFVKPGRPFVVYYSVAEPLQHMFLELKNNPKVGALKLTCNWLRNYQVLPERTHPEVTMNNQSGFLLTGYTLG